MTAATNRLGTPMTRHEFHMRISAFERRKVWRDYSLAGSTIVCFMAAILLIGNIPADQELLTLSITLGSVIAFVTTIVVYQHFTSRALKRSGLACPKCQHPFPFSSLETVTKGCCSKCGRSVITDPLPPATLRDPQIWSAPYPGANP